VIIHNFYIFWPLGAWRPFKTDTPLFVDPDTVLSLPVAFQALKPVSRQLTKIAKTQRRFKDA
jgi:hypothetical protein